MLGTKPGRGLDLEDPLKKHGGSGGSRNLINPYGLKLKNSGHDLDRGRTARSARKPYKF